MTKFLMFSGMNKENMENFIELVPPIEPEPDIPTVEEFKFVINSGADKNFNLPVGGKYKENYTPYAWSINWGDTVLENKSGISSISNGINHNYPTANTEYEITITPQNPNELGYLRAFGFRDDYNMGAQYSGNRSKLLRITSGKLNYTAMDIGARLESEVLRAWLNGCNQLTSLGNFGFTYDFVEKDNEIAVSHGFCHGLFSGCENLTDLGNFTLPTNITMVGTRYCQSIFNKCKKLSNFGKFKISPKITISEGAFFDSAFVSCHELVNLGSLNLPPVFINAGSGFLSNAFNDCPKLTNLGDFKLPSSLAVLGSYFCNNTFANNTALTTIKSFFSTCNLSQTMINKSAVFSNTFAGCTGCTEDMSDVIQLQVSPNSSNACFAGCTGITGVPVKWK